MTFAWSRINPKVRPLVTHADYYCTKYVQPYNEPDAHETLCLALRRFDAMSDIIEWLADSVVMMAASITYSDELTCMFCKPLLVRTIQRVYESEDEEFINHRFRKRVGDTTFTQDLVVLMPKGL